MSHKRKLQIFNIKINRRSKIHLAKNDTDAAKEMPFQYRLEEMRIIAKINIAIIRVVTGGEEEYKFAEKIIEEVRQSVDKHFQFASKAKIRLEVLEDFIWVVTARNINVPDPESTK